MAILNTISNYMGLYRKDVLIISFLAYIAGAQIANGLDFENIIIGLLVAGISTNFGYSFNSWADWKIDQINKPYRPIPSGKIKPKSALIYSLGLLVIALIYPLFIFRSYALLALFWMPLLGVLYSAKPFNLKKSSFPAVTLTSIGLTIPWVLGYSMNAVIPEYFSFIVIFLFFMAFVPINDVEDKEGDIEYNCENCYARLGKNKLLLLSMTGMLINVLLMYCCDIMPVIKYYWCPVSILTFLIIASFLPANRDIRKLYRVIRWNLISMIFVLFFYLRFF